LATNRFGGIKPQWAPASYLTGSPTDAERALESQLVPFGVGEKTRAAVLDQLEQTQSAGPAQSKVQIFPRPAVDPALAEKTPSPGGMANAIAKQNGQIAGLLLGSPEFQRR